MPKHEKKVLKVASAGNVTFKLNALVDKNTEYDAMGNPVDGFSHELEICYEQACGHGWSTVILQFDPNDLENLDGVAKFFLELHGLWDKK
jgi:hypothetical protein